MAIMHPSDINKRKHVKSEEKFYNACRDQLSDKYHVFFSVRWYSIDDEGKREDSECDFLIFNPDYGFLCVEVKGGKGIYTDDDGDWFLKDFAEDRKLHRSPYLQAEESMRFFKKYYEDEVESKFPGTYGSAVAFPNYCINSPITDSSPLELTIDMNSLHNLQKRIVEIFRYYRSENLGRSFFFAPDSQKKFINLINKRVALSVAAGALIEDKERELIEINQTQDVVIDLLANYQKAFIIGGAGTGKTWIGIKKIKRAIVNGKDTLYLCCNDSLAASVKNNIGSYAAECFSLSGYMRNIFGNAVDSVPYKEGAPEYSVLLTECKNYKKYDLIVVDEAQDFTEDWAFAVNLLLKDEGSLYVFYDECQNVFGRDFGDKFYIDEPPFVLRYNIRNTSNIYKYTQDLTNLGLETVANQIEGVEPDVRSCTRKQQVLTYLDSIVSKLVNSEGVSPEKIAILCNKSIEKSAIKDVDLIGGYRVSVDQMKRKKDEVLIQQVEDYKGLESDIVIYINHTYKNEPNTSEKRSLTYTALTRARFYLYIINFEVQI